MTIGQISGESSARPATHGVLAAGVSVILGVAAHGLGGGFGGHGPSTAHLLVLAALAGLVGVVRAGQVRTTERRRARGVLAVGWAGTAAALVAGQVAAHLALSALGHGSSVLPGTTMTLWHAVALPVAVAVLVSAERVERMLASGLAALRRMIGGWDPIADVRHHRFPDVRRGVSRNLLSCAGIRGPPVRA